MLALLVADLTDSTFQQRVIIKQHYSLVRTALVFHYYDGVTNLAAVQILLGSILLDRQSNKANKLN